MTDCSLKINIRKDGVLYHFTVPPRDNSNFPFVMVQIKL